MQVLTIYLSNMDSFLIFLFTLLCVPLSSRTSLGLLIRLIPRTNQGILIWRWRSDGSLSVIGYSYEQQFIWE